MRVCKVCADVLQERQAETMAALRAGWKHMEAEVLVACANDHDRLQENCEGLLDIVRPQEGATEEELALHPPLSEEEVEELEDHFEELQAGVSKVALTCVNLLVSQMLGNCDEVLREFFGGAWEVEPDGVPLVATLTVTLSDYFEEFDTWLANAFYSSKFVRETLERLVRSYLCAFGGARARFADPSRAAQRLRSDRVALVSFFSDPARAQVLRTAGLRTAEAIADRFAPLAALHGVLAVRNAPVDNPAAMAGGGGGAGSGGDAGEAGAQSAACDALVKQFGELSVPVLERCLLLRPEVKDPVYKEVCAEASLAPTHCPHGPRCCSPRPLPLRAPRPNNRRRIGSCRLSATASSSAWNTGR